MKVLLVDDDPAILEVLGAFLRGAGFEVLEAEDGEKALELFPQADLVILDLMLPKVGGLEVARLIRQERPELPLLILTAQGEEEDRGPAKGGARLRSLAPPPHPAGGLPGGKAPPPLPAGV